MLPLDDTRWSELRGGKRSPYDPRPALARLQRHAEVAAVWSELWDELHHQGDVDTAAYAVVPHVVRFLAASDAPDWNPYALLGTIELERGRGSNPPVPVELLADYEAAWRDLPALALRDLARSDELYFTLSALGVIALGRGARRHAEILLHWADDEIAELLAGGA